MPAPLSITPAGGGGARSDAVASIDAAGNEIVAGHLEIGRGILLDAQSPAPVPAPGQLALYTADGITLSLVAPGGLAPAVAGTAVYSRQISVMANGTSSSVTAPVGTWTPMFLTNAATGNFVGWVNQSDGTQNDAITFDCALGAGTYQFDLYHLQFGSRGIYTVKIDGATVGTIDGYTGGGITPAVGSITGIVLAAGTHTITLLMATKNASSSGFVGQVERFLLTRTA